MKSVLISIQPKWCELIASGKKTIEVRKTRPKIDTPFKCYIYCTKPKSNYDLGLCLDRGMSGNLKSLGLLYKCNYETAKKMMNMQILSGKVIGEFMCDNIVDCRDINMDSTCLTVAEWLKYTKGHKGNVWGWHISDLVIYDKPKELSDFYKRCYSGCETCKYESWDYDLGGGKDIICIVSNKKPLTRPPQSWCYVESQ